MRARSACSVRRFPDRHAERFNVPPGISLYHPDDMAVADSPNLKPTADDFLAIIRRQQLGKLKIYLGPRPGVANR
jgi:hypothetical protein